MAWNPAGLTFLKRREVDFGVAGRSARGWFSNHVDGAGTLRGARGLVPDAAVALPLRGGRLVVAGGVIGDGAIAGSWQYRDAPGAAGASYGIETHRSGVLVLRSTGAIAARLGSRVALGGSVSMLWNRNELRSPYIFRTQAPLVGLKTLLDVRATGTGWSGGVGAVVRPLRSVTAGASWRSGTTLTTHGRATGDAWAQFASVGIEADSSFAYDAAVRNAFPSMLAAGATWDGIDHWRLSGQIERWGWKGSFTSLPIALTGGTNAAINGLVGSSRIDEIVPLAWRDQLVRRAGAEFAASPR